MGDPTPVLYVCPFCGVGHVWQPFRPALDGAIAETCVLSIECPCGATFALTRGGRPHARSD